VRASAREAVAVANVLQSFPEDPNTGDDAKALSDDAISTDPTRCTIDYGDEALVNPNNKAVDNGEDDDGNEDMDEDNEEDGKEDNKEDEDEGDDEDDVDYQDVPCDNDDDNELYNGLS